MPVSMHGLDLSFLKTKESQAHIKAMRKRHEASKRQAFVSPARSELECPQLMRDITPFRSPVDKRLISSRSQLAAHNRANNVRQCGEVSLSDYTAHVEKKYAAPEDKGVSFEWIPKT